MWVFVTFCIAAGVSTSSEWRIIECWTIVEVLVLIVLSIGIIWLGDAAFTIWLVAWLKIYLLLGNFYFWTFVTSLNENKVKHVAEECKWSKGHQHELICICISLSPISWDASAGNTVHTWVSYYWGSNIDSPNSNGLSLHFYMICFNGFLLLVVLSNLTLKLVWLILVGVVAAAAPVGALEESLTRARRSWDWSRSLGESTAWSRCSRPWKSQPFRSRLRKVKDLMKGSPAHPRAVKREQAMMTGNGFSAAKLPSLKNAASNLGKKSWKPRCRRFLTCPRGGCPLTVLQAEETGRRGGGRRWRWCRGTQPPLLPPPCPPLAVRGKSAPPQPSLQQTLERSHTFNMCWAWRKKQNDTLCNRRFAHT